MNRTVYLRQLLTDKELSAIKKLIVNNIDRWSESPMSPCIDINQPVTFVKIVEQHEEIAYEFIGMIDKNDLGSDIICSFRLAHRISPDNEWTVYDKLYVNTNDEPDIKYAWSLDLNNTK